MPNFAVRIFDIVSGGLTPRHAHNYEHEVLVLEGAEQVFGGVDGATIRPIRAGDLLLIAPKSGLAVGSLTSTQAYSIPCTVVQGQTDRSSCRSEAGCGVLAGSA